MTPSIAQTHHITFIHFMQLRHAVLPQEYPFGAQKRHNRRTRDVPDAATSFANYYYAWTLMGAVRFVIMVAQMASLDGDSKDGGQLAHAERRAAVKDLEELVVEEHVHEHADGDVAKDEGQRHVGGGRLGGCSAVEDN